MRAPPLVQLALCTCLFAEVAATAFFAVRELRGGESDQTQAQAPVESPGADGGPTTSIPDRGAELDAIIAADKAKPRFHGEILGLFIPSSRDALPPEYKWNCSSYETLPYEQGGQFSLAATIPPPFVGAQKADFPAGAVACDGRLTGANWAYRIDKPCPGELIISRNDGRYFAADVAADRVKTIEVGGRQAVYVESVFGGGFDSSCSVLGARVFIAIPEPFGVTRIEGYNLPTADLMEVGRIVGEATKQ